MPRLLRLLLLLLCISLPAAAQPLRWEVEGPPSLAPVAERLRGLEPDRLVGAMRLVGLEDAGPPIRVIVAPEGSEAARAVPPWVSGYALSEQGIVVILPARTPTYPDSSLPDLFRHEIAHVLVARAAGGGEVPRWFHEGVAMVAGLTWGLDDVSRASLAVMVRGEVPLATLDRAFGGGHGEVQRAYAIAGTFVRDLLERHGQDVAGQILAGVRQGLPFEEAFARATGETLAAAEAGFWERQSFWYRWVPLLTSSVTLWLGITLLAVWAIRRRRKRDAALRARWDEEEKRLAEVSLDEPVN
ncbi:MAG TPA: hypothetical protein VEL74_25200 [Thermoanaerobaculia bacterium]|nr:hypothetical protein [Thermoanaerobaculia bacterium]